MPSPPDSHTLDELITRPSTAVVSSLASAEGDFAVLGAGGKMGFHLCRMLQRALQAAKSSSRLYAVSRFTDATTRRKFESHGIQIVSADLSDAGEYSRLPPAPNIFYLAGIKFGTAGQPELLERMNVRMPELVADHYRDSRIVALSTGCVYSFVTPESGGSIETDETNPPGEYAQSCLGREAAFRAAAERWNTRSALIRLNYSIDLRYGVLLDIAQQVLRRQPVNLETGYVNVIWQGAALDHTVCSLQFADTPPFVLNVTGNKTLRVRDVAIRFGQLFGVEPIFSGVERPSAWINNAAKSHELFGAPVPDEAQLMEWTAEWLLQGGETLAKPTQFQTRDGNY